MAAIYLVIETFEFVARCSHVSTVIVIIQHEAGMITSLRPLVTLC